MFNTRGITFCITGKLGDTRASVNNFITRMGGYTTNSVTRYTVLVVGTSPGATKIGAAERNNALVISEEELYYLAQETPAYITGSNRARSIAQVFPTGVSPNYNRNISRTFPGVDMSRVSSAATINTPPEIRERSVKKTMKFDF